VLLQMMFPTGGVWMFRSRRTTATVAGVQVSKSGSQVQVQLYWGGQEEVITYTPAGTEHNLEFIYDTNNGTANQRLRYRQWVIGGTVPGSFTNCSGSSSAGATTGDFNSLECGDSDGIDGLYFGKMFFSDDTTEDLSTLLGGGAAATSLPLVRPRRRFNNALLLQ
jgi:hypothetical protein